MTKENKTARVERIKKEKDGLKVIADIYRYAKSGEEVDPEDIDRLKWYGLYTQNRTKQDESDETLYFMLRIKLKEGIITKEQLTVLSEISELYAKGTADFTTRQDLQFHYIQMKDLPEIFDRLQKVGLDTRFAAGDVPRNIVSCAVNGIDKDQIADVRSHVQKLGEYFHANEAFSNLPRKFKIGINGCAKHCINHETQDLSFNAYFDAKNQLRFNVSVGGGMASNKRFADTIGSIDENSTLKVAESVAILFRDHGARTNRHKARLGHLIESWGVEKFKSELESLCGFTFDEAEELAITEASQRSHIGVFESIQKNTVYIGCALQGGQIKSEGLKALVEIVTSFGIEKLKATVTQDFILLDIDKEKVESLTKALENADFRVNPSVFRERIQACTGLDFCKFAISETKGVAKDLVKHLESTFPDFKEPITISVNGCPNSCAHPNIAQIGLSGCKVKRDDESVPGFELLVGGYLEGDRSTFSKKTGIKCSVNEVNGVVENVIQHYLKSDYTKLNDFLHILVK